MEDFGQNLEMASEAPHKRMLGDSMDQEALKIRRPRS